MKCIIKKTNIIGTKRVFYSAWEPREDHGTFTYFDGVPYGQIGSLRIPAWIDAIPYSELRVNAVELWYEKEQTRARELILCAFPEAAQGRNDGREIYRDDCTDTQDEQKVLIGCTDADMPYIVAA